VLLIAAEQDPPEFQKQSAAFGSALAAAFHGSALESLNGDIVGGVGGGKGGDGGVSGGFNSSFQRWSLETGGSFASSPFASAAERTQDLGQLEDCGLDTSSLRNEDGTPLAGGGSTAGLEMPGMLRHVAKFGAAGVDARGRSVRVHAHCDGHQRENVPEWLLPLAAGRDHFSLIERCAEPEDGLLILLLDMILGADRVKDDASEAV